MNKNDKLLFQEYAARFFTPEARVLEIGPDAQPSAFRRLLPQGPEVWDTLDFHTRTDVPLTYRTTSEYSYPVESGAYDIVLSANVAEHVPRVWTWMQELARIVAPGGHVVTINPVSWHFHESPVDCWRIYPEGMRALSQEAGLEVIVSEWASMDLRWLERISPAVLRRKQFWQRLSGVFVMWNALTRLPPEGAYDTITVARRPPAEPAG